MQAFGDQKAVLLSTELYVKSLAYIFYIHANTKQLKLLRIFCLAIVFVLKHLQTWASEGFFQAGATREFFQNFSRGRQKWWNL